MNNHRHAWTLGQRLLLINGVMFVLFAAVAVAIRFMMSRISDDADSVRTVNVPQLQRISEMELNVTRVSLQLRHAILARNARGTGSHAGRYCRQAQNHCWNHGRSGPGMFDDEGRQAFVPCKAW